MAAVVSNKEQRAVHVGEVGEVTAAEAGVDVLDHDGAGRGAVAAPQLLAVGAVVQAEETFPVDVGEFVRVTGKVFDLDRAGRGAVALPQAVQVGSEEQGAVDVGQPAGDGAGCAGIDVGDKDGAGGGAVAFPQLPAVGVVIAVKEQRPIHVGVFPAVVVREAHGAGGGSGADPQPPGGEEKPPLHSVGRGRAQAVGADEHIRDHGGAGGGAVALPQLVLMRAVAGGEVQHAVHDGDVFVVMRRVGAAGVDVLDQHGAGGGAVAGPQLFAVDA